MAANRLLWNNTLEQERRFPPFPTAPPVNKRCVMARHNRVSVGTVQKSPVIGTMPESLHPGVICYPHTRYGNLCLRKPVALKFLDGHPGEGIKPNKGLYPKCPILGKT